MVTGYVLPQTPTVDQVAVEARAATFTRRSIKKESKRQALQLITSMIDLTTLEGADTPGRVARLCHKALRPHPDPEVPPVAAVCVHPALVAVAKREVAGSTVQVASVATGFPSGQSYLDVRLVETRKAVDAGADEIDMVINRGLFLAGEYGAVHDEIAAVKEACGAAHLKVILETGELGTYDLVRRASRIAIDAGADFIKTSTGKIPLAATLPVSLVMLEEIRDAALMRSRVVGMKAAGGIKTAKQAWQYLVMVKETLGDQWLSPRLFRIGASSLLNDVLMQWDRLSSGRYQSAREFSEG